jgi:hypothetical protein
MSRGVADNVNSRVKNRRHKKKRKHKANATARNKAKRHTDQTGMSNTTLVVIWLIVPLMLSGFANYFAHKPWILYLPLFGFLLLFGYLGHLGIQSLDKSGSTVAETSAASVDPTVITPDSKPRPELSWNIPENKFLLLFGGDSVAWGTNLPITLIKQRGEPLFVLNKESKGMSVSAKFFSADGKIVAEIDRNQIHENPKNFWRSEKTRHRLVIFNDEAKVVFDLEYLNPKTVKILGDFCVRGGVPISFHEDEIRVAAIIGNHMSFGEVGNTVFNFNQ